MERPGFITAAIVSGTLCASAAFAGEIHWDRYGVPHIYGDSVEDALHGYGYAQMQNHAEQLLLNIAAARGRFSEYFGPGEHDANIESDVYVRTAGIAERSRRWLEDGGARQRAYIEAFIEGANAYAAAHGDSISKRIRSVLPLVPADVMALTQWTLQYNFVGYDALNVADAWKRGEAKIEQRPIFASNAWAIAPRRTARGHAVLIGDPHLPWGPSAPSGASGEHLPGPASGGAWHFMQAHLVVGNPKRPEIDISGISFLGAPFIAIGFNDHLGWTHTVSNLRAADAFEIVLDGSSYRYGDDTLKLTRRHDTFLVCDGGCEKRELEIEASVHGPIIARRGERAVAMHITGLDAPGLIEQYWDMARSRTLDEFTAAFGRLQMPALNLIYADRQGHIMYAFAGRIPVRKGGSYEDWSGLLPGDQPSLLSERVLPWESVPKTIDPPGGFVQNSNDGPWTSTFPQALKPADHPAYVARDEMDLRPQAGAIFLQSKPRFTLDELARGIRSTRLMMAERVLPDLLQAARASSEPLARRAAEVLGAWDGTSDAASRGAALFEAWYEAVSRESGTQLYREAWNPARPLATPRGLADPAAAVEHLVAAARGLEKLHGRIDVPWGDTHRISLVTRNADYLAPRTISDAPASGNDHQMSSLHMMGFLPPDERGIRLAVSGQTYTQIVEFTPRGPNARWVLSYGNATRPGSPHIADQLPAFVSGELLPALRNRKAIEKQAIEVTRYQAAVPAG